MSNKITNVCYECGIEANRLTCIKKYGREPIKKKSDISTYHVDECDICHKTALCTEPRDFFHPDFELLNIY